MTGKAKRVTLTMLRKEAVRVFGPGAFIGEALGCTDAINGERTNSIGIRGRVDLVTRAQRREMLLLCLRALPTKPGRKAGGR